MYIKWAGNTCNNESQESIQVSSQTKKICTSNDTFTKWRKLMQALKLVNNGPTVVYYFLSAVTHSNNQLEHETSCGKYHFACMKSIMLLYAFICIDQLLLNDIM